MRVLHTGPDLFCGRHARRSQGPVHRVSILQDDRVHFRSQIVGRVLAETAEIARRAAGLVAMQLPGDTARITYADHGPLPGADRRGHVGLRRVGGRPADRRQRAAGRFGGRRIVGHHLVGTGDRHGSPSVPPRARGSPAVGATTVAEASQNPESQQFTMQSFGAHFVEARVNRDTGKSECRGCWASSPSPGRSTPLRCARSSSAE